MSEPRTTAPIPVRDEDLTWTRTEVFVVQNYLPVTHGAFVDCRDPSVQWAWSGGKEFRSVDEAEGEIVSLGVTGRTRIIKRISIVTERVLAYHNGEPQWDAPLGAPRFKP